MKKIAFLSLALVFALGCSKSEEKAKPAPEQDPKVAPEPEPPKPEPKPEVAPDSGYVLVVPDKLEWGPLDPSNPEGAQIAVVHGNPQEGASASFLKLPAKAEPGIHTHTSGYHAIVVSGNHKHWLPGEKKVAALAPGSYWWQPGGQPHGDKCEGPEPCVLFIAMDGKWDFAPAPDAKKVEPGDYKMVKAADAVFGPFDPANPDGPKLAILSGDPKAGPVAYMVELGGGVEAGVHSHTSDYHAVVVSGAPSHWVDGGEGKGDELPAGTYWFQPGGQFHGDACPGEDACRAFVIMPKAMDFQPKS